MRSYDFPGGSLHHTVYRRIDVDVTCSHKSSNYLAITSESRVYLCIVESADHVTTLHKRHGRCMYMPLTAWSTPSMSLRHSPSLFCLAEPMVWVW